jgi:hypothetical protein
MEAGSAIGTVFDLPHPFRTAARPSIAPRVEGDKGF